MAGRILLIPDGPASLLYATELVEKLRQKRYSVQVAPTAYDGPSATAFVSELAWATLSGHPCRPIEALDEAAFREQDLILLGPVSPRVFSIFCQGKALSYLQAAGRPVLALLPQLCQGEPAPALEGGTFSQLMPPGSSLLAGGVPHSLGALGSLLLPPLEEVLSQVDCLLSSRDYAGKKVLITAGPTAEDLDPVRFLTNRSTGKMGFALARDAALRGAQVLLVHGPVALTVPRLPNLTAISVRSATQMHQAVMDHWQEQDLAILAAAVADFQPLHCAETKIKKGEAQELSLPLKRTPDILATLGALPRRPFLVGFAAESDDVEANAQLKLRKKHCDLLCANDVRQPGCGFAVDTNQVTILAPDAPPLALPLKSKDEVAHAILSEILRRIPNS
ncbi:MAG: phosphopantothenoylcysteine decarboxylase [Oligosphaeraceae bacterium]